MSRNPYLKDLALTDEEKAFLQTIQQQMGIVADLSRADILLYAQKSLREFIVLSHAQPHSLAHVYNNSRTGRVLAVRQRPEILQTLIHGHSHREQRSVISEGAPVIRKTLPVYYPQNPPTANILFPNRKIRPKQRIIAALVFVTNLIEHERHKLRSEVYRQELLKLQSMLLGGLVHGAEDLSTPFGEQDGILYVDREGIIRYASGIAANLYRRIGYIDTLVGRHLRDLDTGDEDLRREVLVQQRCLEWEAKEGDRHWIRKGIPLINHAPPHWSLFRRMKLINKPREQGVILILHDETEIRQRKQQIRIKNAMIQEVHHRVKNNLQTIAGLLRMQIRRVHSEEARHALDEALNRIMSVAVIHEFLSSEGSSIINVKEVTARVLQQFQYGMLSPDKQIEMKLSGVPIFLPARQATACSLIINELLQNSIEHGFENRANGMVNVNLEDNGDEVIIKVSDNGGGAPDDIKLDQPASMGLQIVKILVEGDLNGQIHLENGTEDGVGLAVKIVFPKSIFEGEEGWNEHVSL